MKYTLIVSLLLFASLCPAQKKPKSPQDTTVTRIVLVQQINDQLKQSDQWLKSRSWYDEFLQYQQQVAYLRGQLDLINGRLKDSTFVVAK